MTYAPNLADALLVALIVGTGFYEFTQFKRVRAAILNGDPRARLRAFQWETFALWVTCLAVLAVWIVFGRAVSGLYLGQSDSWRLVTGLGLAAAFVYVNFRDRRVLLTRQAVLDKYRPQLEPLEYLMPRTPQESIWWNAMSITAGITEEILCRGYLLSLSSHYVGMWLAAPIAALIFGLGHAYQGREGIIRSTIFGLLATVIVLVSGSLIPAILLHVVVDLISGDLGRRIVTQEVAVS